MPTTLYTVTTWDTERSEKSPPIIQIYTDGIRVGIIEFKQFPRLLEKIAGAMADAKWEHPDAK